ncbi:hypothetical protein [Thermosulfurimonas sp. F29]|uniref:hypothetical protein n=1 Tax=Thermosulfurimonas sp. F29 TaxID=2867247 RepID=UPI001C837B60|nr:hypothetical protein [Thermosulfurimonas sp. F29]MBX6423822.1 hypothetical protein [Thermosulfurimonas sp. F29]
MTGRRSAGNSRTWSVGSWVKGFFLAGALLLTSCALHPGAELKQSSLGFNRALQHSLAEQMILNLVRLRYGEPPVFLEVTSISTQYGFSGDLSAGARVNEAYPDSYSFGLGFSYAVKPTFTFVPLQGEEFARRLLSPIPVEHLVLLLNSGWRVDRVLRLCVQGLNGVPNAPTASGPTPSKPPRFETFLRVSRALENLRRHGYLRFVFLEREGRAFPALLISPEARDLAETREVLRLLRLTRASYYPLVGPEAEPGPDRIRVETRSLIGVLFYLSQGVEVPERDVAEGRVVLTRLPDGRPFDWKRVLGDLFRVRESSTFPSGALLAVHYRGRWFYLSDTDPSTKATFVLLQQLFALEASKGKGLSPLLTLPVGS